jgi:hypothetical protein
MGINLVMGLFWIVLIIGLLWFAFFRPVLEVKILLLLTIFCFLLGASLFVYVMLFPSESDLVWNSLFFFPIFFLYAIVFFIFWLKKKGEASILRKKGEGFILRSK